MTNDVQPQRAPDAPRTPDIALTAWAAVVPTMTEKAWLAHVFRAAGDLGYLRYHVYDSRRSVEGFPDIVLVRPAMGMKPGRVIFVELKSERGQLSADQIVWRDALQRAGAEVFSPVRPSDYDQLLEVLR